MKTKPPPPSSSPPEHPIYAPSDRLEDYATEAQLRYLRAVEEHGGVRAAARALGVDHSTIAHCLDRLRRKAARMGYSPDADGKGRAPEGFHVRGKSTYYDAEGKVRGQWVKTAKDAERLEDVAKIIAQELDVPAAKPLPLPRRQEYDGRRMCVYPIGDAHIGLLSWGEETGADHDLQIAKAQLTDVAGKLVNLAPVTDRALIVNVGDFFHVDNYQHRTEKSGHFLDVDSRLPKVITVGLHCALQLIYTALRKHQTVTMINVPGNHDRMLGYMLSLLLKEHFRNEPRVNIRTEPRAFFYEEFGRVLIGATHGEKCKPTDLPEIMAVDQREAWGRTLYRYWYTGHVHHDQRKEFRGCIFESFRTLVNPDAYTVTSGYRSGRDMKCIVLHSERGEVLRHTIGLT